MCAVNVKVVGVTSMCAEWLFVALLLLFVQFPLISAHHYVLHCPGEAVYQTRQFPKSNKSLERSIVSLPTAHTYTDDASSRGHHTTLRACLYHCPIDRSVL